jgi:hypothetical protein
MKYFYILGYWFFTYLYFEFLNKIHAYLTNQHYYLDFGHAKFLLVMVFFLSCITGAVFSILLLAKKTRN